MDGQRRINTSFSTGKFNESFRNIFRVCDLRVIEAEFLNLEGVGSTRIR